MAEWSEIDVTKVGAVMAGIGKMVPDMNLQEVDETLVWLKEEWRRGGDRAGKKMLWGRLKRRQEELLGKGLGSGRPKPGVVVVLTAEAAAERDENRRLRARLRAAGVNPDGV